ncbi:hypothetical protein INT46_009431 [Mucor plumbeus]|uniref:J domain-containing protein n=1 Tax=Mucor plumbeus TaxID=97098 RepID=A0A8H7RJB1_9FUNG|nr:hypothetical protein INT46_009431 [Mucor plumbeus]
MQREQQQQRSPYDILGVGRFTTQKEIRKRYLQLCKTYHPDISSNKNVDFREITVAYEILSSNKNQQALEIKNYNYNHKPINTNLWTKRSYIFGFALVAFTLMYSYEGKASPKVLLPHEKRKLAAQQQLPTTIVATEDQVKSNDVTPWQAAGTSFREWRKGTALMLPSKPITIPGQQLENEISYREIIKQLAQTTTKPYGDIPPLMKSKKKKKSKKDKESPPTSKPTSTASSTDERSKPMRRMSHVEDWIVVDSKESLPDEEELVQSPFKNFLSGDFFTEVLPLHMPPPSLSERFGLEEEQGEGRKLHDDAQLSLELIQEYDGMSDDDDEQVLGTSWKSTSSVIHRDLLRRHSISSFTSSTTTASYAVSSSPPHLSNTDHELWKETLAKLKRSLFVSPPPTSTPTPVPAPTIPVTKKKRTTSKLIPMPIPPRRPISQKRRSEATTQPRFNPDTNTYTRDTRSNPDHLRMISAELNMMRGRKLLSPLKPRGFLPRRKDAFVRGTRRNRSHLMQEILIE